MTLEEAYRELGLEGPGPFDPARVKRAYEQTLQWCAAGCSSETLERLASAYELARTGAAAAHVAASGAKDSLEAYRVRLATLPAEPWAARAEVARAAYAAFPDDIAAHFLLASELPYTAAHAELLALVAETAAAGHLALAERMLETTPADLPEAARAILRKGGSPWSRLRLAELEAVRFPAATTAAVVAEALAGGAPEGLVHAALRVILALHRDDNPGSARSAFHALRTALGSEGLRTGAQAETVFLYELCAELDALADLPRTLRKGIAIAALTGLPSPALDAGASFMEEAGVRAARTWQAQMSARAPTVRSALGWDRRLESGISPKAWALAGTTILCLLMSLTRVGCDSLLRGRRSTPAAAARDPLDNAAGQVAIRCHANPRPDYCDAAEQLVRTMKNRERCILIQNSLNDFANRAAFGPAADLVGAFDGIYRSWCGKPTR